MLRFYWRSTGTPVFIDAPQRPQLAHHKQGSGGSHTQSPQERQSSQPPSPSIPFPAKPWLDCRCWASALPPSTIAQVCRLPPAGPSHFPLISPPCLRTFLFLQYLEHRFCKPNPGVADGVCCLSVRLSRPPPGPHHLLFSTRAFRCPLLLPRAVAAERVFTTGHLHIPIHSSSPSINLDLSLPRAQCPFQSPTDRSESLALSVFPTKPLLCLQPETSPAG